MAVSVITRHGRNQAMHWEEARLFHPGLVDCFEMLAQIDSVFGN